MNKIFNAFKDYKIVKIDDKIIDDVLEICKGNVEYYNSVYEEANYDNIKDAMTVLPKNTTPQQKFFVAFYKDNNIIAILDIIKYYPQNSSAFIGLFMLDTKQQGKGLGTKIITQLLSLLKQSNYKECRLGVVENSMRPLNFWKSIGFI